MMTKQNFEAATKIVQQILPSNPAYAHHPLSAKEKKVRQLETKAVCTAFVLLFRDDNSRFNQERFMKACGVEL